MDRLSLGNPERPKRKRNTRGHRMLGSLATGGLISASVAAVIAIMPSSGETTANMSPEQTPPPATSEQLPAPQASPAERLKNLEVEDTPEAHRKATQTMAIASSELIMDELEADSETRIVTSEEGVTSGIIFEAVKDDGTTLHAKYAPTGIDLKEANVTVWRDGRLGTQPTNVAADYIIGGSTAAELQNKAAHTTNLADPERLTLNDLQEALDSSSNLPTLGSYNALVGEAPEHAVSITTKEGAIALQTDKSTREHPDGVVIPKGLNEYIKALALQTERIFGFR